MFVASLNNLVGSSQQCFRDGKAERLGGLEIDDEFEFARLHDRQIGWFFALENACGIDAKLARLMADAGTIAHQAAGQGVLADMEDGR